MDISASMFKFPFSIILAVIRLLSCQSKMFRLMQQMLLSLQQLIHLRKRKATTYTMKVRVKPIVQFSARPLKIV